MIRIGINGYGNLGRGVELALGRAADMEATVVFTRREPGSVATLGAPVVHVDDMPEYAGKLDVVINCGGSATDLEVQGPAVTALFNTVDSFDTHAKIPAHFAAVNDAARAAGTLALISAGWDPGLFSMLRVLGEAVLPTGITTTFWGPGVSQGHSDAIRRIPGVVDARQYTVPVEETVAAVKERRDVELTRVPCTSAYAMWLPKRAQTWRQSSAPSSKCRTISPIMTPRSTSSPPLSSLPNTAVSRTAAR